MLATLGRRPRMGDQKLSNEGPFGYSFEDINFPFPPPPAPAAGAALLDDNDSKNLDHFFEGFDSDHFNQSLFGNGHTGDMFTWPQDLPPTFMGTTSSFGQQTHPPVESFGVPDGIPTTSAEIFAAATLLQGSRSQVMLDPFGSARQPPNNGHHGLSQPRVKPEGGIMNENNFYEELFSNSGRHPREPSKAVDIRWGSDAAFSNQTYIAPHGQESVEAVEANKMQSLDCFEPTSGTTTAVNTRQPSPVVVRRAEPVEEKKRKIKEEEKPKKRRKEERKSSATRAAEAKAARENLTEEQKRENHIRSEQKRRTLIKEGFEDIGKLVPELNGGGFSKSAVLSMAGDWLEDLIKGNEELKKVLAALEGQ